MLKKIFAGFLIAMMFSPIVMAEIIAEEIEAEQLTYLQAVINTEEAIEAE